MTNTLENVVFPVIQEDSNIIPFKTKPKGIEDDWLSPLPQGTAFLTKDKGQEPVVYTEYEIYNADPNFHPRCVIMHLSQGHYVYQWVNPQLFCKSRDLVAILRTPKEEE